MFGVEGKLIEARRAAGLRRYRLTAGLAFTFGLALASLALTSGGPVGAQGPKDGPFPGSTARARLALALEAIEHYQEGRRDGLLAGDDQGMVRWLRRVYEARRDLASSKAERIAAAEEFDRAARSILEIAEEQHRNGQESLIELLEARYFRAEAEELLARARAE